MPNKPQQYQQPQHQQHVPVSQMPQRSRHAMPTNRVNNSLLNSGGHMQQPLPFSCRLCDHRFGSNQEVIEHIDSAHRAQAAQVCCYVCDYCPTPLIFETEDLLRQHMEQSHNHVCEMCNKVFPNREDLMVHKHQTHGLGVV